MKGIKKVVIKDILKIQKPRIASRLLAPSIEYSLNRLLENLQKIYFLKGIINHYGNKAVSNIQNRQENAEKQTKKSLVLPISFIRKLLKP